MAPKFINRLWPGFRMGLVVGTVVTLFLLATDFPNFSWPMVIPASIILLFALVDTFVNTEYQITTIYDRGNDFIIEYLCRDKPCTACIKKENIRTEIDWEGIRGRKFYLLIFDGGKVMIRVYSPGGKHDLEIENIACQINKALD